MKKSDQVIIAVGVVVIIIAAVGILLWKPAPSENAKPEEAMKNFKVEWTEKTATISPDNTNFYARDRIIGADEPYKGNVSIPADNLKSVTFTLTWKDDHTFGLLRKKGEDTLTLEIIPPEGSMVSDQSIGNGTILETFDNINLKPYVDSIKANDSDEAKQILEKEYYSSKWKDEPFQIHVNVSVGEKFFKPIRRMLDKGNNFTLEITYTYYEPTITEEEQPQEETPQTSYQETTSSAVAMITRTGCIRGI